MRVVLALVVLLLCPGCLSVFFANPLNPVDWPQVGSRYAVDNLRLVWKRLRLTDSQHNTTLHDTGNQALICEDEGNAGRAGRKRTIWRATAQGYYPTYSQFEYTSGPGELVFGPNAANVTVFGNRCAGDAAVKDMVFVPIMPAPAYYDPGLFAPCLSPQGSNNYGEYIDELCPWGVNAGFGHWTSAERTTASGEVFHCFRRGDGSVDFTELAPIQLDITGRRDNGFPISHGSDHSTGPLRLHLDQIPRAKYARVGGDWEWTLAYDPARYGKEHKVSDNGYFNLPGNGCCHCIVTPTGVNCDKTRDISGYGCAQNLKDECALWGKANDRSCGISPFFMYMSVLFTPPPVGDPPPLSDLKMRAEFKLGKHQRATWHGFEGANYKHVNFGLGYEFPAGSVAPLCQTNRPECRFRRGKRPPDCEWCWRRKVNTLATEQIPDLEERDKHHYNTGIGFRVGPDKEFEDKQSLGENRRFGPRRDGHAEFDNHDSAVGLTSRFRFDGHNVYGYLQHADFGGHPQMTSQWRLYELDVSQLINAMKQKHTFNQFGCGGPIRDENGDCQSGYLDPPGDPNGTCLNPDGVGYTGPCNPATEPTKCASSCVSPASVGHADAVCPTPDANGYQHTGQPTTPIQMCCNGGCYQHLLAELTPGVTKLNWMRPGYALETPGEVEWKFRRVYWGRSNADRKPCVDGPDGNSKCD